MPRKTDIKHPSIPLEPEVIEQKIYLIRGHKVMLDRDLAELYCVKAIRMREQVKRNMRRFPPDFMFQLNESETHAMVSQNAIPSRKHLGPSRMFLPNKAFPCSPVS